MFKSWIFLVLLSVPIFAFEQTDQPKGTVNRPGLANLLTGDYAKEGVSSGGHYFIANRIAETPRAMTVSYQSPFKPSIGLEFGRDFVTNFGSAIKVKATDFAVMSNNLILDKFYFLNLKQTYNDIDIWGAYLGLRATPQGKVFFAGGQIFPGININPTPAISIEQAQLAALGGIDFDTQFDKISYNKLVILPLIFTDKIDYRLCYVFEITTANPRVDWRAFVDAHTGEIIWRENTIRYETISGAISGSILPATPYDTQEVRPFANTNIYVDDQIRDTSDVSGNFSFNVSGPGPYNVDLYLRGPYFRVLDQAYPNAGFSVTAMAGDVINHEWNEDNSTLPQNNAYYHGQTVHDFIKTIDPNLTVMNFPMVCRVNVEGSCNAFYSSSDRSVNFYRAGGGCPNIVYIGDVVYHEYGHGLTNQLYQAGGSSDPDGAMHEGFSDYIAGAITGQPLIGRGFTGPGTYLRTLDNNRRYPDNWNGESHNDGMILSGALWDLRQMLESRPGYADTLWQYAKYGYGLDFDSYFWDMLAVDDDDGNIDNGTPHAYEIYHSFGDLHGIGPGIQVQINHSPLIDSEDSITAYVASADVQSLNPMTSGSAVLHYSTGGVFSPRTMVNFSGTSWSGTIPSARYGTTIRYYIEATDNMGFVGRSPSAAPDSLYSFYVGYDTISPVVSMLSSPRNTVNLFGPYGPFIIRALDSFGIESGSAVFHYQINDENELTLPMRSDSLPGKYVLDSLPIARPLITGDIIHYWFTCRDGAYLHNSARLPQSGTFALAMSDSELVDDFEAGSLAGWQVNAPGWVWLDHLGYRSQYCMKSSTDNYTNNMNSIVYRSRAMNFTRYSRVWLQFMAKYAISAGDSCYVVVTHDPSGPWTSLGAISGSSAWVSKSYELAGFVGPQGENVYYGLQFVSDASGTSFGILIDDIALSIEPITGIEDNQPVMPRELALAQNYPNPFNMKTAISFYIPNTSTVKLDIYDILGQKVAQIYEGQKEAGYQQFIWDGRNTNGNDVSSGKYFYRLQVGDKSLVKSMTLLK